MSQVTSKRPYLIRAMHEWMTDNNLTPFIVIDAAAEGVSIPEQYVADGRVILNVSYSATRNLTVADDTVSFETRFEGRGTHLEIPTAAILGIYAQESGQGMIFTDEGLVSDTDDSADPGPDDDTPTDGGSSGRPNLKVVK
ncbi:MAG: ClpXP protease specificity-enhancing factor [Gammaproteobacteria bacterium]